MMAGDLTSARRTEGGHYTDVQLLFKEMRFDNRVFRRRLPVRPRDATEPRRDTDGLQQLERADQAAGRCGWRKLVFQ
jgi:hypothetical protein